MSKDITPNDESTTTKKRVTVRVPEELAEEYDEQVENRSEAIRAHMRAVCESDTTDDSRIPPQDDETLKKGYETLRDAAMGGGMPVTEAKTLVASICGIPKDTVQRRVLRPLKERGYVTNGGDPYNNPWILVN